MCKCCCRPQCDVMNPRGESFKFSGPRPRQQTLPAAGQGIGARFMEPCAKTSHQKIHQKPRTVCPKNTVGSEDCPEATRRGCVGSGESSAAHAWAAGKVPLPFLPLPPQASVVQTSERHCHGAAPRAGMAPIQSQTTSAGRCVSTKGLSIGLLPCLGGTRRHTLTRHAWRLSAVSSFSHLLATEPLARPPSPSHTLCTSMAIGFQ